MSDFSVWCEILCDNCNKNAFGAFYRKGIIKQMRNKAKENGWKIVGEATICPDCLKQARKRIINKTNLS